MAKNRIFLGITLVIAIVIVISIYIYPHAIFVWTISLFKYPDPPKPEITYGEFPIKITYEVDGVVDTVEDIIICEFDGFETLGEAGKYRKWKARLESGNEQLVLLKGEDHGIIFEISESYGLPDYYMGDYRYDVESYEASRKNDNELGYIQWENDVQTGYIITKDEAWEKYKLKIIDIQYSEPIKNTFK